MSNWTVERVEIAKTMWVDGYSAMQISRHLNCGITRSGVLGKLHRMHMPPRPEKTRNLAPTPRSPIANRLINLSPQIQDLPLDSGGHPEPARLENGALIGAFEVNDRMCRYPHGDPGTPDFHFCGQPPKAGSKYCLPHHKRVTQPKVVPDV